MATPHKMAPGMGLGPGPPRGLGPRNRPSPGPYRTRRAAEQRGGGSGLSQHGGKDQPRQCGGHRQLYSGPQGCLWACRAAAQGLHCSIAACLLPTPGGAGAQPWQLWWPGSRIFQSLCWEPSAGQQKPQLGCVQGFPGALAEQPPSVACAAWLQPSLSPGNETPPLVTAQSGPLSVFVPVSGPVHTWELLWPAKDTEPRPSQASCHGWGSTGHILHERRAIHPIRLAVHAMSEGVASAMVGCPACPGQWVRCSSLCRMCQQCGWTSPEEVLEACKPLTQRDMCFPPTALGLQEGWGVPGAHGSPGGRERGSRLISEGLGRKSI